MSAITTVLIANRGEIACRVIDTCQRMGLVAVAVYSDTDRHARHVRLADQAVCIGPAPAQASYLNIERIIEAAQHSRAHAIHPGYGFLAENAAFAQAVIDAELVFVGPSPTTIEVMGSKAQAKALLGPQGVPLIPGFHGQTPSDEALIAEAHAVGWPLMVKAAAGGGGKGMRVVHDPAALADSLDAARREAQAAFGDDRLILERYLPRPRHIEAQILGDVHGDVVHLHERDCSSQRRHQKVIEEAPAAGLSDGLRRGLSDAAIKAAKAVGYVGAGTVEFLVDEDDASFYFLEMNTRLQVEHPVTEMITGLDLVEWQLKLAMGAAVPAQRDIPPPIGHAFEARVYAEDPEAGFLPATGTVSTLHWPADARIDSGIDAGDAIGIDYDPMIAKVIVHGPDRAQALGQLQHALAGCFIDGVTTNLGFLTALSHDPAMVAGTVDTGHLDRALPDLLGPADLTREHTEVLAGALWARYCDRRTEQRLGTNPWAQSAGWRLGLAPTGQVWLTQSLGEVSTPSNTPSTPAHSVEPTAVRVFDHGREVQWGEASERHVLTWHALHWRASGEHTQVDVRVSIDETTVDARAHLHPRGHLEWVSHGRRHRVDIQQQWLGGTDDATATGLVTAPMPGQVTAVHASADQPVQAGEVLALMEAMKMELSIRAPFDGTVGSVWVAVGDRIEANAKLIEVVPTPPDSGQAD